METRWVFGGRWMGSLGKSDFELEVGSSQSAAGSLIRTLQFNIWKFFFYKGSRLLKKKLPNIKLQKTNQTANCRLQTFKE
jgi:hypothetical protein